MFPDSTVSLTSFWIIIFAIALVLSITMLHGKLETYLILLLIVALLPIYQRNKHKRTQNENLPIHTYVCILSILILI